MQCPKCHAGMQPVERHGLVVQRCKQCAGLWFEPVDHERLEHLAEDIDSGDVALGRQYNRIDRIDCPQCGKWPLLRMVDPLQPHIWFESCKKCHGRFYDAGEFRDFAEHDLIDYLRDINAPERDLMP